MVANFMYDRLLFHKQNLFLFVSEIIQSHWLEHQAHFEILRMPNESSFHKTYSLLRQRMRK
jgi:hypothetical protein